MRTAAPDREAPSRGRPTVRRAAATEANRRGRPTGYSGCENPDTLGSSSHRGNAAAPKIAFPFRPQIARKSLDHIGSVRARSAYRRTPAATAAARRKSRGVHAVLTTAAPPSAVRTRRTRPAAASASSAAAGQAPEADAGRDAGRFRRGERRKTQGKAPARLAPPESAGPRGKIALPAAIPAAATAVSNAAVSSRRREQRVAHRLDDSRSGLRNAPPGRSRTTRPTRRPRGP